MALVARGSDFFWVFRAQIYGQVGNSTVLPLMCLVTESPLKLPDVIKRTGICRARIYVLIKARTFPAPIKVGVSSLWVASEVNAWILDTIAAARAPQNKNPNACSAA